MFVSPKILYSIYYLSRLRLQVICSLDPRLWSKFDHKSGHGFEPHPDSKQFPYLIFVLRNYPSIIYKIS